MLFEAVIAITTLVGLLVLYDRVKFYLSPYSKIPGPLEIPVIGSLSPIKSLETIHTEWYPYLVKTFGPVSRFSIFGKWFVFLNDPALTKEMLITYHDVLVKGESYQEGLGEFLHFSILNSDGELWTRQKQVLGPFFAFDFVQSMLHTFDAKAMELAESIREKPGSIDADAVCREYAMENICKIGFGFEFKDHEELTTALRHFDFCLLMCQKMGMGIPKAFLPMKKFYEAKDWLSERVLQMIHRRKEEGFAADDKTVLRAMMDAANKPDGEWVNEDELVHECLLFMFAGSDTTAWAISVLLYFLCRDPTSMLKVYEEAVTVLPSRDDPLTPAKVKQCKYLDCCMKEALRIWPSAPHFGKECIADINIGGHKVPKGSIIINSPHVQHRDIAQFGDDVENWRPDRFLPDNSSKRHPYAFSPFSNGKRSCIGQNIAMLEIQVATLRLVRNFEISIDKDSPPFVPVLRTTMIAKDGNHLEFKPRP